MKKFIQKLGIIAASGLIFGALAGASFTGVKVGADYITEVASEHWGNGQTTKEKEDGTKSNVVVGETQPVTVAVNDSSKVYDVADLAEQLTPSVVSITSTTIYQNPYAYFYYGESAERTVTGCGSGVIIGEDEERLLVATNNHVVEGTESITVGFSDGTDAEAVIVGSNAGKDLAVVSVLKSALSEDTLSTMRIASLGDSEMTRIGEPVIAIGNALGYGQSLTVGYVSAKDKPVTINNASINMIQTDAAINEGNSGGALFDMQGKLIGINSAKARNMNNNVEGMGYAIPISDALPVIQGIIDGTQLEQAQGNAYMGIQGKDLSAYDAASFNMPQGVYLLAVIEGAPADQAGLQSGDVITAVDGTKIATMAEIKAVLAGKQPGDTVTVTLSRSDQRGNYAELNLTVTLGSYVE